MRTMNIRINYPGPSGPGAVQATNLCNLLKILGWSKWSKWFGLFEFFLYIYCFCTLYFRSINYKIIIYTNFIFYLDHLDHLDQTALGAGFKRSKQACWSKQHLDRGNCGGFLPRVVEEESFGVIHGFPIPSCLRVRDARKELAPRWSPDQPADSWR